MKVAIIMGSTSDLPKVEPAISILKNYGVEVNVRCLSAHRAHLGLSSFIIRGVRNYSSLYRTWKGWLICVNLKKD